MLTGVMAARIKETELYGPVKRLLEGQGYMVKGEVVAADLVAMRADEDPVIVELKTGFSLTLFHQAIDRQAVTDHVYVAVPRGDGSGFFKALKANRKLCRRLGLGLITVRLKDGFTEIHEDPAPYRPRPSKPKRARMLKEFAKRVGDPNEGGTAGKRLMTAYRQDALRCATLLRASGPCRAVEVAKVTGVERARTIMYADHYGWFERVETGIYALTPKGAQALNAYAEDLALLKEQPTEPA